MTDRVLTIKNPLKDMEVSVESQTDKEIIIKIRVPERQVGLADLKPGTVFKVGKREFIVLEHDKDTTAVILKDFLYTGFFDKISNNYAKSTVRDEINGDFCREIEATIGANNLIPHIVDLTANDGLKDYALCVDKVSLMTADNYRRYREFLPAYGRWWYLATAFSTKSNGYSRGVCYVGSNGAVNGNACDCSYGVRPFCIFSSDIVVTPIEE